MNNNEIIQHLLGNQVTGGRIYNNEDFQFEGLTVLQRNEDDSREEYYYSSHGCTVTISYMGSVFKSTEVSGSYGVEEWTDWAKATPKLITTYVYDDESPY